MIEFDHMKLAKRNSREIARYKNWFIHATDQKALSHVRILHEDDDSCCRKESWLETSKAIAKMLPFNTAIIVPQGDS